MKKLRILFLAVLATALVVSGAFAAELTAASVDKVVITRSDKVTVTAKTLSTDVVSPDKAVVLTFDFSAADFKDYDIEASFDAKAGFEAKSKDYKFTVSFDVTKTTEKGLTSKDYKVSFKFFKKSSGTSDEDEDSDTYTYDTSTKHEFVYAGTAGAVAYYTLNPIETANELDSTYTDGYYSMTKDATKGVETYTKVKDSTVDKNDNGSYWRITAADTGNITIPQTVAGTTYALANGDGTYQAVDNFEQGDAERKYYAVTAVTLDGSGTDVTGKYEKSSGGVYTVTSKTGAQTSGEFFTIETTAAAAVTLAPSVTYALHDTTNDTYTTATTFTTGTTVDSYVVITTEQGLKYADLVDSTGALSWNEDVTGNSNKAYATAEYDEEGNATYTVVDTTKVTKPVTGTTYFVITPKAADVSAESDITDADGSDTKPYKYIGNEEAGTYTLATEWITAGTLTFAGYDKDTKYVTVLSSKDVTSEVTNDNFSKGVYYTPDSNWRFSRAEGSYNTKNKYYRLAVSEWKTVAAADLVSGTDYYTSNDITAAAEETGTNETGAIFDDMTLRQSYASATGAADYTMTFTVSYNAGKAGSSEEEKGGEEEAADKFAWVGKQNLDNLAFTLYIDSKDKPVTTHKETLAINIPEGEKSEISIDVTPDTDKWELILENENGTKSGDVAYKYDITFSPLSVDTQSTYKLIVSLVSSKDCKPISLDFKVAVALSGDKKEEGTPEKPNEKPGEDDGHYLTVTAEADETTIYQGQTVTVTVTASPMNDGYEFSYEGDEDAFTVEEDSAAVSIAAVQGTTVTYTLRADDEAEPGDYDFVFTVTSGEVTSSDTVTITVLDFDDMPNDEKIEFIKNNPEEAPKDTTSDSQKELNKKAFEEGEGEAIFTFTTSYPVKPNGWRLRFVGPRLLRLIELFEWLLNGSPYQAAAVSALSQIAEDADSGAAISVNAKSKNEAEYTLDVEKTAKNLDNGKEFAVRPVAIPEKYADVSGDITDADKESEPGDSVGTITGYNPPTETTELLGGSSGGCDAGFGALALALAASMIFVRKRS